MTVNVAASGLSVTVTAQGFRSWCFGSGDSVIFTAVPSGGTGTYIYNWSPANDLSSTNTAATTAKPTAVGLYSYSVLVTDGNGCQVSAPAPVTVFALPVATITALDTTAPCAGDSVHLAASPGSGYTYQWKLNGNNVTGAVDINYTTADAGTYTAVVTNIICSTTSNSIPVTVRPLPSAAIAAQGSLVFCEGGNDLLLASIGTGYSYQWTENGLAINGAGLARYTAQDSGSYYCNITLNGCTVQSNPLLVTVLPNPLDLVTVTGATDFCAGDSVLLSVSTGTGYVYQWQKDGTVISSATADSYNATATGLYSVAVSLSSCSVISLGVPVTVNPYPSATVTANGSTTFCTGDSVTLNASTGTGYNYQWFNGTDTLTDALAPSIVVVDSGMYYVNVSSNGCVSISNTVTVEALPLPDAFITQAGQTLTASPGATYQWYNGNTLITGATQQSYTPSAAGNYSVMVTDANGCAQESAPYSFNALGISILTQDQSFSIYPNPIETENWNLDVSNGLIGTDAEVFDQSGKLIYKTVIQNLHSEIDLKIATGVYFLKINSQGTFMMKKLIKL